MQEVEGSENHKTAAAMVKAVDDLWDACGRHDPTVTAATTNRSKSLAPVGEKRVSGACSKSHSPSIQDFFSFQNPGNGMCKYHNYYSARAFKRVKPCAWSEN